MYVYNNIVELSMSDPHTITILLSQEFQKKLGDSRRIVVVGNGGIATELV